MSSYAVPMSAIRPCRDDEQAAILAIVNAAAQVYRGVIPADRWHEPYMDSSELAARARRRCRLLGLRGGRRADRRDGHPAGGRRRPDPPRLRASRQSGRGRRARAARAPARAQRPAHAGRHVGGRGVGHPLLPPQRLRAGLSRAQDGAAAGSTGISRSARSRRRWCWRTRRSARAAPRCGRRDPARRARPAAGCRSRAIASRWTAGPITETLTGSPLRAPMAAGSATTGKPTQSQ